MLLIRNHKDNSCKTSSAQDIQLSSQYTTIADNQTFLREYSTGENPVLLFLSDDCLNCLRDAEEWHLDGNFFLIIKFN